MVEQGSARRLKFGRWAAALDRRGALETARSMVVSLVALELCVDLLSAVVAA